MLILWKFNLETVHAGRGRAPTAAVASHISLGYPYPINTACYIVRPDAELGIPQSNGDLLPEDVFCPKAHDGGSGCCRCLWKEDFLARIDRVNAEFEAYEALEDKATWPYRIPARPAPIDVKDRDSYLPPLEADLSRHRRVRGGWVHASFMCRVTLTVEEFQAYFTVAESILVRLKELRVPKLHSRLFHTYCTPNEQYKYLIQLSERRYDLKDERGRLRVNTKNFQCVPDPADLNSKPKRMPLGVKAGRHMLPFAVLEKSEYYSAPMQLTWGAKRKRTQKSFTWGIKGKRRRLRSVKKMITPSTSICQVIPSWRTHIGENAQIIARIESASTGASARHRSSMEGSYDPTRLIDPDDYGEDEEDDTVEYLGGNESSDDDNDPISGATPGNYDSAEDDESWLNLIRESGEANSEYQTIDLEGAYPDYDSDDISSYESRSEGLYHPSANVRLLLTHSSVTSRPTVRVLEESGHSNEVFLNIQATPTEILARENPSNAGVYWDDLKIADNTMMEACTSPNEFASDLHLVTAVGHFLPADPTLPQLT